MSLPVALDYRRAGLCVLPARLDPKMAALATWKEYQARLPTEEELREWIATDCPLCIVTGAVSGNLEMIDFDCQGEKYSAWLDLVRGARTGRPGGDREVGIRRPPRGLSLRRSGVQEH